MSKLEYYCRPLVAFDPNNDDHRRWYHEFVEYGGWGRCPVRFICPNDIGHDLTIMIRNVLIDYYIDKEFKPAVRKARVVAKKPQRRKKPVTTG